MGKFLKEAIIKKGIFLLIAGLVMAGVFGLGEVVIAAEERAGIFKDECGEDIWCLHDKIVDYGNEDLCSFINDYFNDQDQSVVGYCYYEIAKDKEDCSICEKVVKQDIKELCERECSAISGANSEVVVNLEEALEYLEEIDDACSVYQDQEYQDCVSNKFKEYNNPELCRIIGEDGGQEDLSNQCYSALGEVKPAPMGGGESANGTGNEGELKPGTGAVANSEGEPAGSKPVTGAVTRPEGEPEGVKNNGGGMITISFDNPTGSDSAEGFFNSVMGSLRKVVASLAILFMVIGGVLYIFAGVNQSMIQAAKACFFGAIAGLALFLAAPAFLTEIKTAILGPGGEVATNLEAAPGIQEIVSRILSFLLSIIGVLAIIGMAISGLMYLTVVTKSSQVETAKRMMTYSIIGIVAAGLSLLLVSQIIRLLG